MIYGTKYWKDKTIWYVQTNNVLEVIDDDGLSFCGTSASMTCLSSIHMPKIENIKVKLGNYSLQKDDILGMFLNDPKNEKELFEYRKLEEYRGHMQEVPQYYPYAIKELFKENCYYIGWNFNKSQVSKDIILNNQIKGKRITWDYVVYWMKKGYSLQTPLISPGHYISIVAYDSDTNELIYYDPWPNRKGLKNRGFQERMNKEKFTSNTQGYGIVYV
jgi:hypothetical protein